MMTLTTLCYIKRDCAYLMLHRTKKENDINEGKWIAPGGHIEDGETPEQCARREVTEETGLVLSDCVCRGIIHFISPIDEEEMFVFSSDSFEGKLIDCDEGELAWVSADEIMGLNLWEGDRRFLKLLLDGADFFRMTLRYDAEGRLVDEDDDGLLIQTADAVENHLGAQLPPNCKKALIVTGRHSARACGALSDVERALDAAGIEHTVFDGIEENPSVDSVTAARDAGLSFSADFCIAIGGGSPMDAAKGAALLLRRPDKGAEYLYEAGNASDYAPVICVPTTCGTGSEATAVAVLSRPAIRAKGSIPYKIWAALGLMDIKYLRYASPQVIRNTAMDALSHLCESYVNANADAHSRAIAAQGLMLWGEAREALVDMQAAAASGADAASQARANNLSDYILTRLMTASTIAGMSIAATGTSLPHALSYTLTTRIGTPHGIAVGYFLAGYMRAAGADGDAALALAGFDGADELDNFYHKICDVPTVSDELISQAAASVMAAPAKLALSPFAVDEGMLVEMAAR